MKNPFDFFGQMKKFEEVINNYKNLESQIKVTGAAGAGLVTVIMDGNGKLLELEIDNSVYSEQPDVLKDLVKAAINDANSKRSVAKKSKMKEFMAQLGLPQDFPFPFMEQ